MLIYTVAMCIRGSSGSAKKRCEEEVIYAESPAAKYILIANRAGQDIA